MAQVNIHEAKTHLSRLLDRAAAGEDIVIARAGQPIARLVRLAEPMVERRLGLFRGQIHVADDFDQLPEDLQRAFEGEGA